MNDLNFQPSIGSIDDSEEKVEDVEVETTPEEESSVVLDGIKTYSCPRCKAVFSTDNMLGANCVYCGARGVIPVDSRPFNDYVIVPFTSTVVHAKNLYHSKIRMNPLIPFSFRGNKVLRNMRKIYLVCNYYNFDVGGNISFLCAEKVHGVKGAPSQTFETMFSTNMKYENMITSQFPRIGDELLSNINNYNFKSLQPFVATDAVILGGDVDSSVMTAKLQEKISKHAIGIIRGSVPHTLKKVGDNQMSISPSESRKVLIPIYYLNLNYKGKEHFFLMNGQTNTSIIDLPISGVSVLIFSLVVFAIIFAIGFAIAYLV